MGSFPETYRLIYHKEYLFTIFHQLVAFSQVQILTHITYLGTTLVTVTSTLSGLVQIFESKMQDFFQTFSKRIISVSRLEVIK